MDRNPYAMSHPLCLSLGSSAFNLSGLIHERQGLPSGVFTGKYTPEHGVGHGLLTHHEASMVDEKYPFHLILTSQLSMTDAAQFLAPGVPGINNMKIIHVDTEAEAGAEECEKAFNAQSEQRKILRSLPAQALEKVEEAILAQDEERLRAAINAAKEHWAEHGRYLSKEESDALGKQSKCDITSTAANPQDEGNHTNVVLEGNLPNLLSTSPIALETRVARLRADYVGALRSQEDYVVALDTSDVEMEAWTLLELEDWAELNEVWVELASNADSDWEKV